MISTNVRTYLPRRRFFLLTTLAFSLITMISLSFQPVTVVSAAPVDFKNTDFVAAAPYTYNHETGGGAYDDRTIGDHNDVVEQLEGAQFSCNDTISFLIAIQMEAATVDAVQTAEFDLRFLADSTGQSGAAIIDVLTTAVNYGPTQGGDGSGGKDSGINDDGGSTASLVRETLTGPLFTAGSSLLATVRITDLEAGEKVIVRVDTKLGCKPNTSPTGNLQAQLDAGRVVGTGATISTGQQTIPFLRIGDIAGTGEPLLKLTKTVTTISGTCGQDDQDSITVDQGEAVKFCYQAANLGTWSLYDVQVKDDNATQSAASDDFIVPFPDLPNLDGQADLGDIGAGQSYRGEYTLTYSASGTHTNTAVGSGNNGLSGGNFSQLTDSDTASVNVITDPTAQPLTWNSETLLVSFEDLKNTGWSDWDYNDFVVSMEIRQGLTAAGNLGALEINYEALARGAGFNHRFLHQLPLMGTGTAIVTVRDANNQVISQEAITFNTDPTFPIFDRTRTALPPLEGYFDTNTRRTQSNRVPGFKATLSITLDDPTANPAVALPPKPWDPYIEVINTNEEVHLVIPGHLDNTQTVNDAYEANNAMLGYDLPLAQVFHETWNWPLEFASLWRGYPQYVNYFGSGGVANKNWYLAGNSVPDWLWLHRAANPNSLRESKDLASAEPSSRYFASPVASDLNGDGRQEFILGDMLANRVEVFDAWQRPLPGWPKEIGAGVKSAAAIADLDKDGDQEILVGAEDGRLYAWHHNGQDVNGWPVVVNPDFRILATPAVGDLNSDGLPEIVVPAANGRLYAFYANGQPLSGWPVSIGDNLDQYNSQVINSSPKISDLNKDGKPEVIAASTDKKIYVFDANGSLKWTYTTGDMILSTPLVGEIDKTRPGLEIAFGSGDGYFYLLGSDGQLLWKRITGWTLRSSPTAADLDNDGDLELLIGGDDDKLWVWHHDGRLVSGWPQSAEADIFSSPVVGDLDGDGDLEIVVGSDAAKVYAWHTDGSTVTDWPKQTQLSVKGSPVITNLDEDAELEVIVGDFSGQKYIWNFDRPFTIFLPITIGS